MNAKTPAAKLTWLLLAFLLSGAALAGDPKPSRYEQLQEDADAAWTAGDYRDAFARYGRLAREGDSFSQYRISYMYFQGQGRPVDWSEAFAWAVLAAESNHPDLVKYLGALAQQIPEQHHEAAAAKAEEYLNRWGMMAIAENARLEAIRELRKCTGSRLGTRCEEVYSMQMPRFWTVQGKPLWKDPSEPVVGSISGSNGNDYAGGPVLNTRYYQALRWGVRDLDVYISQNAGNVTIGDLETVEPASAGARDDG